MKYGTHLKYLKLHKNILIIFLLVCELLPPNSSIFLQLSVENRNGIITVVIFSKIIKKFTEGAHNICVSFF